MATTKPKRSRAPDPRLAFTTVRDVLRYAVSRFNAEGLSFGHGTQNAFDEAAYLILFTLDLPLDRLDPFLDARLLPDEMAKVLDIVDARIDTRKPAAYLTHEAWLADRPFYVDERVIVPRSFIAELLRERLAPWVAKPDHVKRVLDLCTGGGSLAILAAEAFPGAEVDAVDVSPEALDVAHINVEGYGLEGRVFPIESDGFAALKKQRYDLILSNPPYVNAEGMAGLPDEYRHEPALALGSGEDGLDFVRRILKDARNHLTPDGLLVVEIGHNRAALERAFPGMKFGWAKVSAGENFVFVLKATQLTRH